MGRPLCLWGVPPKFPSAPPMAAMSAALQGLLSVANPNPNLHGKRELLYISRSPSSSLPLRASSPLRCAIAHGSTVPSLQSRLLRNCFVPDGNRRFTSIVASAAPGEDSKPSDIELENVKGTGKDESEMAWEQVLESFKEQALKIQSISQEAYELYSKKAIIILEETSKTMKIQAGKASRDIAVIAKEISVEGKQYISAATENSPDSVKDIVQTFSSLPDDLSDTTKVQDFHFGIPYGAFLAFGGFTSFMFTGSTSAIRFGIILGSALLALSISSMRAWKQGKPSSLLLKGQAAIATIIFVREWRLLFQKRSLSTSLMTIISGAMLVFYIYRIIVYRQSKGQSLDQGSED